MLENQGLHSYLATCPAVFLNKIRIIPGSQWVLLFNVNWTRLIWFILASCYIYYKVLLLAFIALNGLVMAYLSDLLRHYIKSRLLHTAKTGLHNPEDYFSQILPRKLKYPREYYECEMYRWFYKSRFKTWLFRL